MKTNVSPRGLWDYEKKLDLKKPAVLQWYLERKIDFGDWESIKFSDLKNNLKKLKINPYLKKILEDFVKTHEKRNFK